MIILLQQDVRFVKCGHIFAHNCFKCNLFVKDCVNSCFGINIYNTYCPLISCQLFYPYQKNLAK